jgi:hypothetical protein
MAFGPDTLFAVSFKEVLGRGGDLITDNLDEVRRKVGLPRGSRLALIGIAQDDQMEALWHAARPRRVWQRIASMGFEFVTSCTYSVWDETPRFDQIRNQGRNLQNHDVLANLGVPTIPFLFPFDDSDYRETWMWLAERPDVNKVAVLAHYYRRPHHFAQFIRDMRKLQSGADRPLEFLVVGAAKLSKLSQIFGEFKASVVAWKPFQAALGGLRTTENLHHPNDDVLRLGMSREELAHYNIERYIQRCQELRSGLRYAALRRV